MEKKKDRLIRGTAMNGKVRAFAVRTTELVDELRRRHDTYPTATAALGRTVTAAAIMGAMLKGQEKLAIMVKGNGPLGQITAESNALGEVRGYVSNPHVHLPSNSLGKLDVAGAVGTEGFIDISKDLGMKEPYRGSVPIVSGELGEDFTYYFAISEQTPAAVGLGVLVETDNSVRVAGGFIIQLLPGLTDEEITEIEHAVGAMPSVTAILDQGLEPEEMLRLLLPDAVVLDELEISFVCQCSRERIEETLVSLGQHELEQLIEEDDQVEVICHYCNEAYVFNKDELQVILDQAKS
ncbi:MULTISPECIES: Hsp33 family molecular chaperone HslO [Paenibacillus]|jgi:molecular chaperone Hsp33|uniref:Hsp33 family molecular chaperone HslO n=1 Tax=Paenibacillus TaxID=44249 RepID=UPI0004F7A4E3|nr:MULTISPECIES: Hsp33 family molecular chaperone HslO [unclassified Paenibacillus]AIQ26837.1 heat shock protein Hsp33 [Paenibacillus sp. FSL P4-0081]OMF21305.1 Hsp33 family molecular chaperone [Paenibacillus sp. FSL H8-0259]